MCVVGIGSKDCFFRGEKFGELKRMRFIGWSKGKGVGDCFL